MSASHQREAAIFDAAMELPPEQRAAYLDEACGGDAALRQRVESLLKANESQCVFLDPPAVAACDSPTVLLQATEKAGDTIGRYKLLEQIGEGGCGMVYVAEQTEPVRRRVALKIIKMGMDTRSVIARFEAERQALALMDHPNIAKVLDAGATDTGRPYFVMELVRGLKITDYCDQAKLSTRARLDLFIHVCQAIQHAHQKGIIHRDIKPSNILVTVNDGVPVPKVIDFGIAKATAGQQLTDKTIYTAFEQFIGTPAYMSPEQAVLTSLDIDTRSDIYALGVLLYELLTGRTPFDAKELLAIGLDEMRRTIREQEPPRPSTRVSTLPGQELSTTAQRRGLDAPKLVTELRGDLDWIVMKALEKDRSRRYETANGLASDILRHLKNEPVVARPPSRVYRFQKLVRRNKLAFAAATAVATALVAGVMVSIWQGQRAKAERDSAEAVLKFFREKVLAAGRPEGQEGGLGIDVTLRQAIDAAEPQIAAVFQNRPVVAAAIRQTIGDSYWFLGEPALAIQQSERALALRQRHLGIEHPHTLDSMNNLAIAYRDAGKLDQALHLHEETLKLRRAKQGPEHPKTLGSMNNLAVAYKDAGKLDQALLLHEETLKLRKAKQGPEHPDTLASMVNLAAAYQAAGKVDQALLLYEKALELQTAKQGPEHPDTLASMNNLADSYMHAGKLDPAVLLLEQAVKVAKVKLGPEHLNTRTFMYTLGDAYRKAGKLDQLEAMYRDYIQRGGESLTARIRLAGLLVEVTKMNSLASHRLQELTREAEQLLREYLAGARSRYTNEPLQLARRLYHVADVRYRQGNYPEADPLYREVIELRRARLRADHKDLLEATASLARVLADWAWAERTNSVAEVTRLTFSGSQRISANSQDQSLVTSATPHERAREAERLLKEVLALRLRNNTNSSDIGDVKSRLGAALVSIAVTDRSMDADDRRANLNDAEALLLEGHERLQMASRQKKYQRDALERLVRLYETWGKPEQRSEWQKKLDAFHETEKKLPPSEPLTEDSLDGNDEPK